MVQYGDYHGKLIRLNKEYPIYDREDDHKIIGYTEVGDTAVITYIEDEDNGYYETVIVSGKYIGVDTLALNHDDIRNSTFLFNHIDNMGEVYINDKKVKYEYI